METTQTNNFDLLIGIDPGVHTGLAVFNCKEKKLIIVTSSSITEAISTVQSYHHSSLKIGLVIEDARKRKWINDKGLNDKAKRGKAMGAGANKRDAKIWEDFCKENEIAYKVQAPRKGLTKKTQEEFLQITGWQDRTNSHSRDAAMLVFGKIVL